MSNFEDEKPVTELMASITYRNEFQLCAMVPYWMETAAVLAHPAWQTPHEQSFGAVWGTRSSQNDASSGASETTAKLVDIELSGGFQPRADSQGA